MFDNEVLPVVYFLAFAFVCVVTAGIIKIPALIRWIWRKIKD